MKRWMDFYHITVLIDMDEWFVLYCTVLDLDLVLL
jgi:hypothetical protein